MKNHLYRKTTPVPSNAMKQWELCYLIPKIFRETLTKNGKGKIRHHEDYIVQMMYEEFLNTNASYITREYPQVMDNDAKLAVDVACLYQLEGCDFNPCDPAGKKVVSILIANIFNPKTTNIMEVIEKMILSQYKERIDSYIAHFEDSEEKEQYEDYENSAGIYAYERLRMENALVPFDPISKYPLENPEIENYNGLYVFEKEMKLKSYLEKFMRPISSEYVSPELLFFSTESEFYMFKIQHILKTLRYKTDLVYDKDFEKYGVFCARLKSDLITNNRYLLSRLRDYKLYTQRERDKL